MGVILETIILSYLTKSFLSKLSYNFNIMSTYFGEQSVSTPCHRCKANVMTRTDSDTGSSGKIIALILCLVGCWPCCLIPFCMDSMKETTHTCPQCHMELGKYKP